MSRHRRQIKEPRKEGGPALGSLETILERFWLILNHRSAQGKTPEAGVRSYSGSVAPAVGVSG